MGRAANVSMGINVPDFVSNKDVYEALDNASESLEKNHIEVHDIAVEGLTAHCHHSFNASEFTCDECGVDIREVE